MPAKTKPKAKAKGGSPTAARPYGRRNSSNVLRDAMAQRSRLRPGSFLKRPSGHRTRCRTRCGPRDCFAGDGRRGRPQWGMNVDT
eukprot:633000-Amphidinium_carterae.1